MIRLVKSKPIFSFESDFVGPQTTKSNFNQRPHTKTTNLNLTWKRLFRVAPPPKLNVNFYSFAAMDLYIDQLESNQLLPLSNIFVKYVRLRRFCRNCVKEARVGHRLRVTGLDSGGVDPHVFTTFGRDRLRLRGSSNIWHSFLTRKMACFPPSFSGVVTSGLNADAQ